MHLIHMRFVERILTTNLKQNYHRPFFSRELKKKTSIFNKLSALTKYNYNKREQISSYKKLHGQNQICFDMTSLFII
jgi:hypothetical protein